MPDLIRIASYPTSAEAELAKGRLADEGVQAVLEGAAVMDIAWHLNVAVGGVKLLVAEEDAERAHAILNDEDTAATFPPWDCPQCGAEVDAGYAICWSCGAGHPDAEPNAESDAVPPEPSSAGEPTSHDSTDVQPLPPGTEVEPCPKCAEDIPVGSETCPVCGENLTESPADAALKRAWRSAVIGIFLLQGFLHLYSLYQLYQYFSLCDAEGRDSEWRAWAALAIDLLAIVGILLLMRYVP